jgi:hypothetical protein
MIARRVRSLLLVLLAAGIQTACSEGTPVAPTGAILRMSVSPSRISGTGTADVTVQALRGNGNPVNPGTEIRLSTTIGTIDPVVHTDNDGVAHATLKGDGRVGTAKVSAYSGAIEPVEAEVAIGSLAASVRLQVTPASIPETGGILSLLALVRDDQGQPLPDASVNFTAETGVLTSGGSFLLSDANGEASDSLTVAAADLQTISDDNFEVTAEVGGTGGVQSDAFSVTIQRIPRASFTFQRVDNTVTFTDTSTGGPTSWLWSFGDSTPQSTQRNPVHTFPGLGNYSVTLTVSNAIGSDSVSAVIQIP